MIKKAQEVFTHLGIHFSIITRCYTSPKEINNKMVNPHFHEQYELVYVYSGEIMYKIDGNTYTLKKGDFAVIPPYAVHITEKNSELEMYVINFTRNFIERHLNQIAANNLLSCLSNFVYRNNKKNPYASENIRYIIRQLFYEFETEKSSDGSSICAYWLFVLLESISKYSKPEINCEIPDKKVIKKSLINSILDYVDWNYASISKLEDIANQFFISKAHLCKLFKKELGCTAIQYLTNLKINHAIELFKTTNYSAKKISESVGFESNSYFSKVFKEKTGYAPSVYRELLSIANAKEE